METKIKGAFFLFLLILLNVSVLQAAVSDSNETAGAEQARFEQENFFEPKTKEIDPHAPKTAPIRPEEKTKGQQAAGVKFILKKVTVTGNESIPTVELESLAANYINKEVNLEDLKDIANAVKQYYRDRGYIAAYVYLPPQNVTSGNVEIAVIEGKIGAIEIKGNKWYSEKTIRRALQLSEKNVLFYNNLQKSLNYINRRKDIKAQAVLKPGKEAKTTDVEINVQDKFPVHLSTDVNNLGTDNTGKHRWGIALSHSNLLGLMDELTGRFQIGSNSWSVGANYTIPVTEYQTALTFSYSRSSVDLGGQFAALDVEGKATTYGINLNQPVWENNNFRFGVNAGFDWKSVENKVGGAKAGVDELRILNLGLNLEENDRYGRTIFPQSFHFGFSNFLGSSDNIDTAATRIGTGGQFFIYRSSLLRYNALPHDLVHSLRGSAQLTPDRLPPSEQFRLGGAFSVRGYPEGDYLADNGALVTNEIYIPTYFFPADWKLPYSKQPLRKQIRGVAFYDFGGGSLKRARAGEDGHRFLAGAGGGVRIELMDHVFARFQWAGALGARPTDGSRSNFHFGISAEVF